MGDSSNWIRNLLGLHLGALIVFLIWIHRPPMGYPFTVARILHTLFYLNAMQPWRTIAYTVGALTSFALIIHLFVGFVMVGGD